MSDSTRLYPLDPEQARRLADLLRQSSASDSLGLALDERGNATGVVPVAETDAEHVLGDLDVHA